MDGGPALAPDPADAIRQARRQVDGVRASLEDASAPAVDRCGAVLEAAAALLRAVRSDLARSLPEDPGRRRALANEAASLRQSIRGAALLLESAARYHAGWNAVLSVMSAGYTASGAPAAAACGRGLCIEG
jgi:hypothetical protein